MFSIFHTSVWIRLKFSFLSNGLIKEIITFGVSLFSFLYSTQCVSTFCFTISMKNWVNILWIVWKHHSLHLSITHISWAFEDSLLDRYIACFITIFTLKWFALVVRRWVLCYFLYSFKLDLSHSYLHFSVMESPFIILWFSSST